MKTYANPLAFKAALEERLKNIVRSNNNRNQALQRVRTLAVMERFMARVMMVLPDEYMLKGGLALELRLSKARSTKDMDFRFMGDPEEVLGQLRSAAHGVTWNFVSCQMVILKEKGLYTTDIGFVLRR